jgi:hypothetical protein
VLLAKGINTTLAARNIVAKIMKGFKEYFLPPKYKYKF